MASSLPVEERYCRGDRTWYTLDAYLQWAVQFFGTKEGALRYWQKRMRPRNAKPDVIHPISNVHVDRRVAAKVSKPGMPPDVLRHCEPQHVYQWNQVQREHVHQRIGPELWKSVIPSRLIQNGEPLHAYEWNEVQGQFYCLLCSSFATEAHISSRVHKHRSQWPETYLWYLHPSLSEHVRHAPDCVPQDLLQHGEPPHAYEWIDLAGEFYCKLCRSFATGRHTSCKKHKYRSQHAEAYLWEACSQKSSSSTQCFKRAREAKASQSSSGFPGLPVPEWRDNWSTVD